VVRFGSVWFGDSIVRWFGFGGLVSSGGAECIGMCVI